MEDNTLPKYRFQLFNPLTNELITLKTPPIEWAEGVIEIKRDIKIGGIFTSFVATSLTFLKDGKKFLDKIWDEKEINGQCDLIVSWFKNSTRTYQEMPTRFGLNFATCKPRVKIGKFGIGFLIEAQKSSILVKLENRRDKDIDITKNKSLGGADLIPTIIKKTINFSETDQRFQSEWSGINNPGKLYRIANNKDYNIYTQFHLALSGSDFKESRSIEYITGFKNKDNIRPIFHSSSEDRSMILYYTVAINVVNPKNFAGEVYAIEIELIEYSTIIISERILDCGNKKGEFFASGSLSLNVLAGQSIRVYVQTDDVSNVEAYIVFSYFRLVQNVIQYTGKILESMPICEAFDKTLQHITDSNFPFYSEFFGRKDVVFNKAGDTYPEENQTSFANIMTGLNLRGAAMFHENNPMPVSFNKLFESASAIWNLGYSEQFIDGFNRIVIEPYSSYFENIEVLNLSNRISIYDIETEVMPELAYSQIKSGFNKYSYEVINGRGEFNTESQRTTILNTDSVLNLISSLRGDTTGINEKIIQPLNTEDSEEDNELFLIKTQRDGLDAWRPEKEENIRVINNTSLFSEDTLNLYFTPLRMMLRHGNKIKGNYKPNTYDSFIRFQTSDKMQTLETSGEGLTLKENQDYQVNDLSPGIFRPIKHTVTCKFTYSDFSAIIENKKGYITFSPTVKGYLLSLKKKNNEDKATIEIIEKI